ncbi:MAG: hypothetical protein K1X31_03880, partial [Gemmatimonadaceae bacterium]|nr:hypothetical protein [Gemmatimonadaceae bacterium]
HFPVGRRLAFDAAKGRFWVVCQACRQWNLSPLEERWEAIEAAERMYRDTRLRAATDNIGLARLRDGTELVRIGAPLRPEFAAWRYGDRFRARYRRNTAVASLVGAGGLAVMAGGWLAGFGIVSLPLNLYSVGRMMIDSRRVVARLTDDEGPLVLTARHAAVARILPMPGDPLGWRLTVPHHRLDGVVGRFTRSASLSDRRVELAGAQAVDAARRILPVINAAGGRARQVEDAVKVLEGAGALRETFLAASGKVGRDGYGDPSRDLSAMPIALRLAMEMAVHEDLERRALEGELAALEATWRDAEAIARIADDLTLPEWVGVRLDRLSRG